MKKFKNLQTELELLNGFTTEFISINSDFDDAVLASAEEHKHQPPMQGFVVAMTNMAVDKLSEIIKNLPNEDDKMKMVESINLLLQVAVESAVLNTLPKSKYRELVVLSEMYSRGKVTDEIFNKFNIE